MPPAPRQPLRLESIEDGRVVVLGCETCELTVGLHTSDDAFVGAVQAFFVCHAGCVATIELT